MMQSDIAGLKIRERWRRVFRSASVVLCSGLLTALAIWMLVLGADSPGWMASQLVGRKYILPAGAIGLLFVAVLCVFCFFPVPRSPHASGIRFSVFIIRKHFPVFLGIAVLVPVLAYVVFFMLAENQTAAFDRNFSLLARQQIRQISDWKDRQNNLVAMHAGLPGHAGIVRHGQWAGMPEGDDVSGHLLPARKATRKNADVRKPVQEAASHDMSHVLKSRRIWMGPPKRIANADGTWRDVLTMYVPFMKKTSSGQEAGVRLHYVNPAESLVPVMSVSADARHDVPGISVQFAGWGSGDAAQCAERADCLSDGTGRGRSRKVARKDRPNPPGNFSYGRLSRQTGCRLCGQDSGFGLVADGQDG